MVKPDTGQANFAEKMIRFVLLVGELGDGDAVAVSSQRRLE